MARAISDDELQLKRRARRRLIGAIVLVAAIVVVLPMVLDSEPRPAGQAVSVKIPSPDAGVFTSKPVPLPATSDSRAASKAVPAKPPAVPAVVEPKPAAAEPPSSAKEAPAKESPKGEPKEDSKPVKKAAAKPAAKQAKPAAKSDGKFVVQVIALADAGKAKQMQESIAAAGINSYTEVVKTSKGDVTRVRAGPFASRAAAEKAREQLKALGMNGNITTR
jgi:DedD protein